MKKLEECWLKKINKDDIHPDLLKVINITLNKLIKKNKPFKVYSALRTFSEQDDLYSQGRTKPGSIVTNARGGQSMHNYGLAVDMAPFNLMTPQEWDLHWPNLNKSDSVWFKLEQALTEASQEVQDELEYEWGGRWKFKDTPHCQVRTTITELSTGRYPHCSDTQWLIRAHTTFLFNTKWMDRRIQFLLNELGYNVGPVDGVLGKRSKDALDKFKKDYNVQSEIKVIEQLLILYQSKT